MNKKLYSTDAFGRSADPTTKPAPEDGAEHRLRKKSHNRFFAGYTVQAIPRANGKRKTVRRVYTGEIYRQQLERWQAIMLRALYVALFAASVALFIRAESLPTASNHNLIAALAMFAVFVCYARVFLSLSGYLLSTRDMKIREYRDVAKALEAKGRHTALALLLSAAISVLLLIVEPESYTVSELYRLGLLALSILPVLAIGRVEATVPYTEIPAAAPLQTDSEA